jgi:hypothetical protein
MNMRSKEEIEKMLVALKDDRNYEQTDPKALWGSGLFDVDGLQLPFGPEESDTVGARAALLWVLGLPNDDYYGD